MKNSTHKKNEPLFLVQQPGTTEKQCPASELQKDLQQLPVTQPKQPVLPENSFDPQLTLQQIFLAIFIPFCGGGMVAGILLFLCLLLKRIAS